MSGRLRLMTGAITTCIFLAIGLTLISEGDPRIGAALAGLGVFRGAVLVRQAITEFGDDDGDDDA